MEVNKKDTLETSMINKEDGESEEYPYIDFLSFSYRIFISLFMLNLIQNFHLFFELLFLNKKYNSDTNFINAVGGVHSIFQLVYNPFVIGQITVIEILGMNAFSGSKNKVFGNIIHRTRFIGYVLFVLLSLLMISISYPLFKLLNYPPLQRDYGFKILLVRSLSILFEFEYYILLRILMITNNGIIAFVFLTITFFSIIFFAYFFISVLSIGLYGVGLVPLTSSLLGLILCWIYILKFEPFDKEILELTKNAFKIAKVKEHLYIIVRLIPITALENLDNEVVSIFAGFLDANSYAAYNLIYSIYQISLCIANGFYNATNMIMSEPIGKGNYPKTKKWTYYLILTAGVFSLFLSIVVAYPYKLLLGLLTNKMVILNIAYKVYLFFVVMIFLESINNTVRNILKSLQYINLCLIITITVVSIDVLLIYLLGIVFKLGLTGIALGYMIYLVLSIITFSITLYIINWVDTINDIFTKIDEIDMLPTIFDEENNQLKEDENKKEDKKDNK